MSLCSSWFFALRAAVQRGASHSSSRLKAQDTHHNSLLHSICLYLTHVYTHTHTLLTFLTGREESFGESGCMTRSCQKKFSAWPQFPFIQNRKSQLVSICFLSLNKHMTSTPSIQNVPVLWQCPLWCFGITGESCPPGGAHRLHSHADTEKTGLREGTYIKRNAPPYLAPIRLA